MDDDDYSEKPICCSVNTFLCTNYLWGLLSAALLAIGVVGVVLDSGIFVVLPTLVYYLSIGVGGFGILMVLLGVIGQKKGIEICFIIYVFLLCIGLLLQTIGFVFLLLYANSIATIESADEIALELQTVLEDNLVRYSAEDPASWKQTQDEFVCCGVDFEAGLTVAGAALLNLESGDLCSEAAEAQELASLRQQAVAQNFDPNNGELFEPALESQLIGRDALFFCKDVIGEFMRENTPFIGAALGVFLLLQFSALVASTRMYWVPEYLGGWQVDEFELNEVAARKNIDPPKKAEDYGGGFGGEVKAGLNRLSFRFNNARIPDPNVPRDAGFMNRFSMRRPANQGGGGFSNAQSVGFGEPNPIHAPKEPAGPPPSMFRRLSNRLTFGGGRGGPMSFGKAGVISFPTNQGSNQLQEARTGRAPPPPGAGFGGRAGSASPSPKPPVPPPSSGRGVGAGFRRISQRFTNGLFGGPREPAGPPPPSFGEPGPPPPPKFGNQGPGNGFGASSAPPSMGGYGGMQPQQSGGYMGSNRGGLGGGPSYGNTSRLKRKISNNVGLQIPASGNFGSNRGLPQQQKFQPPLGGRQTQMSAASGPGGGMPQMYNPGNSRGGRPSNAGGGRVDAAFGAPPPQPKGEEFVARGKGKGGGGGMFSRSPSKGPSKRKKTKLAAGAMSGNGGLLAQIQQGQNLRRAVTNDKSAPKI